MNKYREGKAKRTPVRGVKEILKSCAYKLSESHQSISLPPDECVRRKAIRLLGNTIHSDVGEGSPGKMRLLEWWDDGMPFA